MSAYESGLFEAAGGGDDPAPRVPAHAIWPDGGVWPLRLIGTEEAGVECRRCGAELLDRQDFEVAELLALVDDHAVICPGPAR